MTPTVPLGAPGIYRAPSAVARSYSLERMDVCAFVGVAPRGPAWVPPSGRSPVVDRAVGVARGGERSVPVAVESWDEYRARYGGFEGPGALPYAVRAFFEQGGRRAYVVRVVAASGVGREALGALPGLHAVGDGPVIVHARDEGSWGDGLRVSVALSARELPVRVDARSRVTLPDDTPLTVGAVLRLPGGTRAEELFTVRDLTRVFDRAAGGPAWQAQLDPPPSPVAIEVLRSAAFVELIEATVTVDDQGRREVHAQVALAPGHPRFLAKVLRDESALLWPDASWVGCDLRPDDPALLSADPRGAVERMRPVLEPLDLDASSLASGPSRVALVGGRDDYGALTPNDFFDASVVEAGAHREGIQAVADVPEVAMLCVPDLYDPRPEAASPAPSVAGSGRFERCFDGAPPEPARPPTSLPGLRVDPALPDGLARVVALQGAVVAFAEEQQHLVALLDVPPGLRPRQVDAWRSNFRSSYAAAYHPWLKVAGEGDRADSLTALPPSAVAAGIIARRELRDGLATSPANEPAVGVPDVADRLAPDRLGALHQQGVNGFVASAGRVWLAGARTLSADPAYRQLSVRRLMSALRRALREQSQWVVFEPHTHALRAELERALRAPLRALYRAGALRGASESEAFFVRCDESLNPPGSVDAGRLVVEVGVAPAEPVEFIVLRLHRDDGGVRVEG